MTDLPNPDLESRLRAALTARADAVEPVGAGAEASTVERMATARRRAARRRVLLAAAATVLVVAAIAGALALAGDEGEETGVATGGEATTTSPVTVLPTDDPVIWPLPTMSVQYLDSVGAAQSFVDAYLGLVGAACEAPVTQEVTADVACGRPCADAPASCPASSTTTVRTRRVGEAWVVTGAASDGFDVTSPQPGATVGADIEVLVEGLDPAGTATATVPPLGADPSASPAVDTTTTPLGADGSWRVVLGAADGPAVLVVSDGASATARAFTVDSVAVPEETTTTTTGPDDDGTRGWPGATSRSFDTPEAAAHAFATDVLRFAEPVLADLDAEGTGATAVCRPRPGLEVDTSITLHDAGPARGWVVTGATSPAGQIDEVGVSLDVNQSAVDVAGRTARSATVVVQVLDASGVVLGETTVDSGPEGFRTTVFVGADGPRRAFVLVAERDLEDISGFVWGVVQ